MQRVGAEVRRQDLVAATVSVIAEHGVKGATTRRIAEAAGCPLASLHYVFHSKDELFFAVYETLVESLQAEAAADTVESPVSERAARNIRRVIAWLEAHPTFSRAQWELFNWALRHQPKLAIETYRLSLESTRKRLRRSESSSDSKTLDALSRLSLILIDGITASWFAQGDSKKLMADVELACAVLSSYPSEAVIDHGKDSPARRGRARI
jgi:AcrR family transcriptional regulator